jgi:hypothetical protein
LPGLNTLIMIFDACETDGRLRELGGLVACDVMMNNTDRIPIHIWRHTGNANNLMLGSRITGIDNTCTTLVS